MVRFVQDGEIILIYNDDGSVATLTDVDSALISAIVDGEIIAWNGDQFEVVPDVNVSNGYITGKKSGVYARLDAPSNTTTTDADTWYPIAGAFTNNPIENFVFDTDHIKYIGTATQHFEIDWHATVRGDTNGTTMHITTKINTSVLDTCRMGAYLKTSGEEFNMSGTCVVELAENDEIQLILQSDSAGDIITIVHFTTTICEFFD